MDMTKPLHSGLMFSDEATFHISGKVNRHKMRVRETENHATLEYQRDSPKVNVYCARRQIYSSVFLAENAANGINYLDMLQNWLMTHLTAH
jgi:hypothetical protein